MHQKFAAYLNNAVQTEISRLLSIHPPKTTNSQISGVDAGTYLVNLGLILAHRIDLIPDPELRAKLGFSEQPQWPQQPETVPEQEQIKTEEGVKDVAAATFQHIPFILVDIDSVLSKRPDLISNPELKVKLSNTELPPQQQAEVSTEQVKTAPEQLNKVVLYPDFNAEELRTLLLREILLSTLLTVPDAEEFATYLTELDQFKCILNSVFDTTSPYNRHYRNHTQSLTEKVLLATLRYAPMNEILQKWVTERTADFKELLPEEKEKFDEEIRNLLMKVLFPLMSEGDSVEGFVKFISEHPLFLEMMALTAEIPVLTHFGRRRKTLQETVQAAIYKVPMKQLFSEWKQSLNETPADPIQPPPEVPNKTERVYDFLSLSFFKSVVMTPQSGPTERYSKEEAASRLVEVVGIPSQTANIVAEELLRQFSQQELKKGFESTLEVQRLFWLWVRSKYSVELFKRLSHIEVHEVKVWIHRLLSTKEACLCAINSGLRIQNLTFLDLIYLLLRSGFEVIPYGFHGDLQSLLNKFNFDALLDTWKRGVEVY